MRFVCDLLPARGNRKFRNHLLGPRDANPRPEAAHVGRLRHGGRRRRWRNGGHPRRGSTVWRPVRQPRGRRARPGDGRSMPSRRSRCNAGVPHAQGTHAGHAFFRSRAEFACFGSRPSQMDHELSMNVRRLVTRRQGSSPSLASALTCPGGATRASTRYLFLYLLLIGKANFLPSGI